MSVYVITNATVLAGVAWTGTAPGEPGTQTVSGTITSPVDLTAMLDEVELSLAADELDFTHMASGGWRIKRPGLKAGTGKLNFHQDFDASQVDARFGLGGTYGFASASTLYLDIKPTGAARGSTNPSYVLQFLNLGYQPFGGGVGTKSISPFSFPTTGLVARLTA